MISINELQPIQFTTDFSFAKRTPAFISNHLGVSDEIARWILDKHAILYKDERHAPSLIKKAARKWIGREHAHEAPVLVMTDACVYTADSIFQYLEDRAHPSNKLIPSDELRRKQTLDLYHLFTGEFFQEKVSKYVYEQLLPDRKNAKRIFSKGLPRLERIKCRLFFNMIKKSLTRDYNMDGNTAGEHLVQIRKIFAQVDELLKDGRNYLTGPTLTLADIAFASIGAPMVLPEEFGGTVARIQQVSDSYRTDVHAMRNSAAGQFILRLYQCDRPDPIPQFEIPKEPGFLKRGIHSLVISLKKNQYKLFHFAQRRFPVLRIPFINLSIVTRNDLLKDMMHRNEDFTVEEINSSKMAKQKGAFFLGMDKMNPQFDRERNLVRSAVKRDDLELIKNFVRSHAEDIIQKSLPYGKLDVADKLNKVIFVRLIEFYFGVAAPTERIMRHWLRHLFYDLFLNLTNNKKKYQLAWTAANERRNHLLQLIKDRKQAQKDGLSLDDNMINRFILIQQQAGNEWFDDENIQRQIGGLITGILETSNKAIVLVLDELFNRPEVLKQAIEAAKSYDTQKMYGFVQEALRFNPVQPGVIRFNEKEQTLTGQGQKQYTIRAKNKIIALTAGAMFDPAAFEQPTQFNPARDAVYMNYGYALHECYGKYINSITLSELVAAVLRLKNVRREPNRAGQGSGLNELSFPNNFVVKFDVE